MGGLWSRDAEESETPVPAASSKKRKRKHEGVAVAKLPVRIDPTVLKRSRFVSDGLVLLIVRVLGQNLSRLSTVQCSSTRTDIWPMSSTKKGN